MPIDLGIGESLGKDGGGCRSTLNSGIVLKWTGMDNIEQIAGLDLGWLRWGILWSKGRLCVWACSIPTSVKLKAPSTQSKLMCFSEENCGPKHCMNTAKTLDSNRVAAIHLDLLPSCC